MSKYENNATISQITHLTEELWIMRVIPDSGKTPDFQPGQYAELALPKLSTDNKKLIRRAYSIASPAKIDSYLEFYLVLVPGGLLTSELHKMHQGDRLWLGPITKGKFTLEAIPPDKNLVMISTGTGIAPYISMLDTFQGTQRWRKFILIHGTRYSTDLGYREKLEQHARANTDFIYIPTVTREPEDSTWPGLRGKVDKIFQNNLYQDLVGSAFSPENSHVFLCGNPEMIDSMEELLKTKGFTLHSKKTPGNIHLERYW